MLTCDGWQVTMSDPIEQMTPSSSEMTCSGQLYRLTVAVTATGSVIKMPRNRDVNRKKA